MPATGALVAQNVGEAGLGMAGLPFTLAEAPIDLAEDGLEMGVVERLNAIGQLEELREVVGAAVAESASRVLAPLLEELAVAHDVDPDPTPAEAPFIPRLDEVAEVQQVTPPQLGNWNVAIDGRVCGFPALPLTAANLRLVEDRATVLLQQAYPTGTITYPNGTNFLITGVTTNYESFANTGTVTINVMGNLNVWETWNRQWGTCQTDGLAVYPTQTRRNFAPGWPVILTSTDALVTGGNLVLQKNWEAWITQADITNEEHQNHLRIRAEAAIADAARNALWAQQEKEQKAKAEAADKRAQRLLLDNLNDQQRKDFFEKSCFYLHTKSGKKYRIRKGDHQNIDLVDETNRPLIQYCVVTKQPVPTGDAMLAQKLFLEACEEEFLKLANAWPYNAAGQRGELIRARA